MQTTYINEHGSGWFFFLASGPTGNPTYAADHRQHCIRKLDAGTGIPTYERATPVDETGQSPVTAGMWHVWAGICDPITPGYHNGARSSARFHQPQGMCMHPRGQLLVADKGNHCIRQVSEEGAQQIVVNDMVVRCGRSLLGSNYTEYHNQFGMSKNQGNSLSSVLHSNTAALDYSNEPTVKYAFACCCL